MKACWAGRFIFQRIVYFFLYIMSICEWILPLIFGQKYFKISWIMYINILIYVDQSILSPCRRIIVPSIHIVYGAMSKIGLLPIFLLYFNFVGYLASSNPSPPEFGCRHVFPLHVWLPFQIQNDRFIQGCNAYKWNLS